MEVPLFSWNVANGPWDRIHIDYAGPFEGSMWLVVVDSFTKWVEIVLLATASSKTTIIALRVMFGRYGVPRQLVSDNGAQFTSADFKQFCDKNGITHVRSTPYHPKTNGLAERMVQTFKQRFRSDNSDLQVRLQHFLLSYRNTPHASTERSPAEMFLGRRLPMVLDRLRPNAKHTLEEAALRQTEYHDQKAKHREFVPGDPVWIENETEKGHRAGTIEKQNGPLSYEVVNESSGSVQRKHADQLRQRATPTIPVATLDSDQLINTTLVPQPVPPETPAVQQPPAQQDDTFQPRRYPQRASKPPAYLNEYI
jgi:hypothetical protein